MRYYYESYYQRSAALLPIGMVLHVIAIMIFLEHITTRSDNDSDIPGTITNKSDNAPYMAKIMTIRSDNDREVPRAISIRSHDISSQQ